MEAKSNISRITEEVVNLLDRGDDTISITDVMAVGTSIISTAIVSVPEELRFALLESFAKALNERIEKFGVHHKLYT